MDAQFDEHLDSSLWSTELLKTEQGKKVLGALVKKWEASGASVVETCTYAILSASA